MAARAREVLYQCLNDLRRQDECSAHCDYDINQKKTRLGVDDDKMEICGPPGNLGRSMIPQSL